ncbi:hypothetical protein PHSC3_000477 [Chlamydiales bacterium STE3]|nr:hypothetical protein PHSC3_000477 [Chlamydiales bacterium STE3]
MRILIAGAHGLVGSALVPFLKAQGHQVISLTRKKNEGGIFWDPDEGVLSKDALENFDVVINLAGENISSGRWTEAKKKKILESRIKSTHLLVQTLKGLKNPPQKLLNASAVGYYGIESYGAVSENAPNGSGFLAKVCQEWEHAALPAQQAGIKTVFMRFGIVLSARGGALAKMLTPFKLGLGGTLGSGKQWMSWIAIDDLVEAIFFVLNHPELEGAINFVSPEPVTNKEFTKALGATLNRPTFFPLPAWVAKLVWGEMAEELLLSGVKASPHQLEKSHYSFLYPNLSEALKHLIK